ncbi:helix-turn-helix domain-containing protein [Biostraticola tofi]|uniref:hypothetical protein n=1 Tax=Biostraticola tofi TaxID=466109 RepID=UPI002E78F9FA|nr:hypothetical protein [Biostraticola tofi]
MSDFENKPESTKLETLFKILSALELELYVVKKTQCLMRKKSGAGSGNRGEHRRLPSL